MIEARELRINNLIMDKHGVVKKIKSVAEAFGLAYVAFENEMNLPPTCDVSPISLTEEWLLKFGFNGWDKGDFTMVLSNGNFMEFEHVIAKNIKHVNQLQNLYFALTNEELALK